MAPCSANATVDDPVPHPISRIVLFSSPIVSTKKGICVSRKRLILKLSKA